MEEWPDPVLMTSTDVQNIERNPTHYAFPQAGGHMLQWNAGAIGTGMHFNPLVRWQGQARPACLPFGTFSGFRTVSSSSSSLACQWTCQ